MTPDKFAADDAARMAALADARTAAWEVYTSAVISALDARERALDEAEAKSADELLRLTTAYDGAQQSERQRIVAEVNAAAGLDKDGKPVKPNKPATPGKGQSDVGRMV